MSKRCDDTLLHFGLVLRDVGGIDVCVCGRWECVYWADKDRCVCFWFAQRGR